MATASLTTLRSRVRSEADMEGSAFVADATLTQWLNQGLDELYDLLVKVDEDRYAEEESFTTDGTANVAVPADFYRLLGVDLRQDGTNWRTLDPYTLRERNRLRNQPYSSPDTRVYYRLRGSQLQLYPTPPTGLAGLIHHVPARAQLVSPDDTFTCDGSWEDYGVLFAALKCSRKEDNAELHLTLKADLQGMRAQLEEMIADRDAGAAARVQNVRGLRRREAREWR